MGLTDDNDDWAPPTDAELKVIAARRERQDKVSKLLGEYLLKGYKMLGTTCPACEVRILTYQNRRFVKSYTLSDMKSVATFWKFFKEFRLCKPFLLSLYRHVIHVKFESRYNIKLLQRVLTSN